MGVKELTGVQKEALVLATVREYPYADSLAYQGAMFYADEAYYDGEDLSKATEEEKHPYANGCDTCSDPAEYMTFPYPAGHMHEELCLYICPKCVAKYGLEAFVEGMDIPSHETTPTDEEQEAEAGTISAPAQDVAIVTQYNK